MAEAIDATSDALAAIEGVLDAVADAGVALAVLRPPARDGRDALEADVLLERSQRRAAEVVLVAHGFRRRPGWGRHPHRFYLRPTGGEADPVRWLKLDVVTDLAFGPRHQWATGLGSACLADRTADRPPRLAPADELVAHLLHALLDKGAVRARDRSALTALAGSVDDPGLLAAELMPARGPASFAALVEAIELGRWDLVDAAAAPLRRRLVGRRPVRSAGRGASSLVLRHSARILRPLSGRGPLVALVGTDGAGKSTLVARLTDTVGVPCRASYGGTYRSGTASAVPGLATARVMSRLLGVRAGAAWNRRMGRMVLVDRHPEEARPLPTDRLPATSRLRRRVLAATLPPPDLMVVLDAPASVLAARRPEHTEAALARDRERHLVLARRPGAVVLDASREPEVVRAGAVDLIWRHAVPTGVRGLHPAGPRS